MDIEFIRGDTKPLKFQVKDSKGNLLKMDSNDELIFTIKKNYNTKNVILQKKLSDGIHGDQCGNGRTHLRGLSGDKSRCASSGSCFQH